VADTRLLLAGLKEYRHQLIQHLSRLRTEYSSLDNGWRAFSAAYDGDAADQFREGWLRTARRFEEYIDNSLRIMQILDERIQALEDANRRDGGLPV